MHHAYSDMHSPVGLLRLVANDQGLAAVLWENDDPDRVRIEAMTHEPTHPILQQAERQLTAYFEGRRQTFDIPLDAQGTEFQQAVWQALRTIEYGTTRSYADIARQIERPKAMRAVGAANGRNPISIIVPCHRVIGANGQLTGFAGGLSSKRHLLELEQRHIVAPHRIADVA